MISFSSSVCSGVVSSDKFGINFSEVCNHAKESLKLLHIGRIWHFKNSCDFVEVWFNAVL